MSDRERKERLHIHRELEYLRSAGRIRRKQPPAARKAALERLKERERKLDEAERANAKYKKGKK